MVIHPFWNYRDELSVEDGLIFKQHWLVIPQSEQPEFLKDLHIAHLGEEKMLLAARAAVHWPNITKDVRQLVRGCTICKVDRDK